MADKVATMQASDLFSLHANFVEQSSSDNDAADFAVVPDANGDVNGGCESAAFNNRNEYTGEYLYCGTDIVSDFGAVLTDFGGISNGKAVTEIRVRFSNSEYPSVTVTGHNHDSNAHAAALAYAGFDVSSVIPASSGGVAVPNVWSNSNTNADPTEVEVVFSLDHVDVNGADGEHFVGNNRNGMATVTARYINTPTLTTTGWKIDSQVTSDSNSDFDGYAITAHKYFTGVRS